MNSQNVAHKFSNKKFSAEYSMDKGLLNGEYISYYSNGNKKSEGKYSNNNRIGTWKAWDYTGELVIEREYTNNFEYESVTPKKKEIQKTVYVPKKNKSNYFEYFELKEEKALFSVQTIEVILPEHNSQFFDSEDCLNLFFNHPDSENFKTFKTFDSFDSFQEKEFELYSAKNLKIVAYKIKRDYVFDSDRLLMESRITFISPVFLDIATKEIFDDNWFYYPNLRSYFAKADIKDKVVDTEMENIEDLFFWSNNSSKIVSMSTHKRTFSTTEDLDTELFSNKNTILKLSTDSEELQLTMIETEHDLWIKFSNRSSK